MTVATVDSTLVLREPAVARAAREFTTTPGRMRLAGAGVVASLLILAVLGGGAIRSRQRATSEVSGHDEALLVSAGSAYTSLANADATATNTFLAAGLEPPAQRAAYLADLAAAAKALSVVSTGAGNSAQVQQALQVIDTELPVYTGMVESARANNRQGYPVGAAYLSEGSALMQSQILPAVGQLYQVQAQRLNHADASGRSAADVAAVIVFVLLALGLLVVAQMFVARRTNRVLNPLMAIATVMVLVLAVWTIVAFGVSAGNLGTARSGGSDPVEVASSAQILVSRSQVDENLALASRGSEPQHLADLKAVQGALGPADGSSGLVAEASRYGAADEATPGNYAAFLKVQNTVVTAANNGQYTNAIGVATGESAGDELPAAAKLQQSLGNEVQSAQATFAAKAHSAAHDLSALSLALVGIVVAAALALLGLERRINEYR
ncbi:MAG: hypothetical protein ACRDZ8_17570 [Acidimicrobiales bacterium]